MADPLTSPHADKGSPDAANPAPDHPEDGGIRSRLDVIGRRLLPDGGADMWRKGMWGIADQALVSATNFVTTVLVARVLSPHEFGVYALAYTGLLFLNTVQSALVTEPHTTLGAPLSGPSYVAYTTDTLWTQILLCLASGAVVLAVALPAFTFEWWGAPILLALAPATVAWQLQTYLRRAMYTRSLVLHAFINDLLSYGGQIVLVVALWAAGVLTPVAALLVLAATSALGIVLGFWQVRRQLDRTVSRDRMMPTARANWRFGKWLLGEHVAYWTSSQVYPIFAAGFVSVAATGALRAIDTVMGPTNVLRIALDPLFAPRAARTYARGGKQALLVFVRRLQVLNLVAIGTYCIAVAILAEPIMRSVFGDAYSRYSWVLVLVSLITMINALRTPIRIGFKTLGQTNAIFRTNLAASAADLSAGLLLVSIFGFEGVAAGLVLNMVVLQGTTWYLWRKATHEDASHTRRQRVMTPAARIQKGWPA